MATQKRRSCDAPRATAVAAYGAEVFGAAPDLSDPPDQHDPHDVRDAQEPRSARPWRGRAVLLALLLALLGAALVALVARGEPRVDGSSPEALMDSLDAMSRSLGTNERERFDDTILTVTAFDLSRADMEGGRHLGLGHYLNGLSYTEIVGLAASLRRAGADRAGAGAGGRVRPRVRRGERTAGGRR